MDPFEHPLEYARAILGEPETDDHTIPQEPVPQEEPPAEADDANPPAMEMPLPETVEDTLPVERIDFQDDPELPLFPASMEAEETRSSLQPPASSPPPFDVTLPNPAQDALLDVQAAPMAEESPLPTTRPLPPQDAALDVSLPSFGEEEPLPVPTETPRSQPESELNFPELAVPQELRLEGDSSQHVLEPLSVDLSLAGEPPVEIESAFPPYPEQVIEEIHGFQADPVESPTREEIARELAMKDAIERESLYRNMGQD